MLAPFDKAGAVALVDRAHKLSQKRQFEEARLCLEEALELDASLPMAHNNLGWVLQLTGLPEQAMAAYRRAISLNSLLDLPRRNLGQLQYLCDDNKSALQTYRELTEIFAEDRTIWSEAFDLALRSDDLALASDWALRLAAIDHGIDSGNDVAVGRTVTIEKLKHDVEQFAFLVDGGIASDIVIAALDSHRAALDEMTRLRQSRRALASFENSNFRKLYNRTLHVRPTPRIPTGVLSNGWNEQDYEEQYIRSHRKFVVIDNFLNDDALRELRAFCTGSTIWFENRYGHGRLGSFFRSGFHCPLLLQVAEELRRKLPRLIGEKHKLRQLWGFKYSHSQPVTPPHADFAAVNVNFWITPDEANLDPGTGGLVVHDVEAPLSWNFDEYNCRGKKIQGYVKSAGKTATTIPYACNRAVIFHSDLFHATDRLHFKRGYESRRMNVTMLFGEREDEEA